MNKPALVLLSGGLDSTAALHWALAECSQVAAVTYSYGQPSADHERARGMTLCRELGVPWRQHVLCEAVRGTMPLATGERCDIKGRNAILLACAAAEAARYWPDRDVALVIGCNLDDACHHVDCAPSFFERIGPALGLGLHGRESAVEVVAPWARLTKARIIRTAHELGERAVEDVRSAWSCYRGRAEQCGECPACKDTARGWQEFEFVSAENGADA